ncbi:MAG: hypothetical protein ACQGQO_10250 [Sphaerochaetaceae bacterium]
MPNELSGKETTPPEQVANEIKKLLTKYNSAKDKTLGGDHRLPRPL